MVVPCNPLCYLEFHYFTISFFLRTLLLVLFSFLLLASSLQSLKEVQAALTWLGKLIRRVLTGIKPKRHLEYTIPPRFFYPSPLHPWLHDIIRYNFNNTTWYTIERLTFDFWDLICCAVIGPSAVDIAIPGLGSWKQKKIQKALVV